MNDEEPDEKIAQQLRRLADATRLGAVGSSRGADAFADDVLAAMLERMTALATLMDERREEPWTAIDDLQAPLLLADVTMAVQALRLRTAETSRRIDEARALAKNKKKNRAV